MSAVVSTLRANSGMVWLSAREAELMRSLGRANHGRANEIIDRRPSRISCFPCPCRRDAVVHLHTRASEKRGSPELSAGRWASDLLKQSPDILQLDLLEVDLVLFDAKMTRASGNGFQECEESAMMAEKKKEANTYLVVQVLRLELNGAHVDEGMLGLALLLLYSVACSTSSTDRARSGRAATRLEEDEKKIWGGGERGLAPRQRLAKQTAGIARFGGKETHKGLVETTSLLLGFRRGLFGGGRASSGRGSHLLLGHLGVPSEGARADLRLRGRVLRRGRHG